jgi:hypothetical protein
MPAADAKAGAADSHAGRAAVLPVAPPQAQPPAEDLSPARASDADAQFQEAARYASGKGGAPSHFLAYVNFRLALLGGKQEAAARVSEERRLLQPAEIRQADAIVDSMRRASGAGTAGRQSAGPNSSP